MFPLCRQPCCSALTQRQGEVKDRVPSNMARIKATAELYKHGKFKQLIISGDKREGYDEPQTMRHDLIERGVPDSIITMDGQGYRTLLSMRNIKQHFRVNDMIIISQKWHNERSIFLADKMNIKAVGYNADDVRHPRAIWTHIRELLARVKLFIDLVCYTSKRLL